MAKRGDDSGTDFSPGIVERVAAGVRYLFTGDVPKWDLWFGPLHPLAPVAPPEVQGRRWDYLPGRNIITQPRGEGTGLVSFETLRALADNYDLLRLVIETRKDQLAKLKWQIKMKDGAHVDEAALRAVNDFFARPDHEHDWDVWLRMLVEDMLVIDAATLYPHRTRRGDLYALEPIDGATIKPILDDWARRPLPPDPAFQQVLKGLPATDYTADDLLYLPRNLRSNRIYGFSPVEQVIMTVNIAMRRQVHQLQYYTEGNVPEALIGVPEGWNPDQVADFQAYWDTLNEGNTAQRRHARFVPATISKSYVATKEAALKDETDEWLARIVCYAFSVSNQWAVKQMNRATADNAQEQALQEGLAPLQGWVRAAANRSIELGWHRTDMEFAWVEEEEQDPQAQAEVHQIYLDEGVMNRDEVRANLGLDKIKGGDVYLVKTSTGLVRLQDAANPPEPLPASPGAPAEPGAAQEPGEGPEDTKAGDDKNKKPAKGDKLAKAAPSTPRPVDRERQAVKDGEAALLAIWQPLLAQEGSRIAKAALGKAAGDDDPLDSSTWSTAQTETASVLSAIAQDGVGEGVFALGLSDAGITSLANPRAVAWAEAHAAQLVKGLGDTTRDSLRALIAKSEAEGWPVETLAEAIQDDSAFSAARAMRIAHTETRTADGIGNLTAWRTARDKGVDVGKRWICRGENICPECIANQADGIIPADEAFTSGDDMVPAHPGCECDVEPVIGTPTEEGEAES